MLRANDLFLIASMFLLFLQVSLYLAQADAKYVFIFSLIILLVMIWYFRKTLPMVMMLVFFLPYLYVPKYYFYDELNVSFWDYYQTPANINFISILNSIFLLGIFIGANRIKLKLGFPVFLGIVRRKEIYFFLVIIMVLLLVYGLSGDNVLDSGRYGTGSVVKKPLYEYFVVFFLLAIFFINQKSLSQVVSLTAIVILYSVKTFLYGGRIEVLQIGLIILYVFLPFFEKRKALLLLSVLISYFLLVFVGEVRSNPELLSSLSSINLIPNYIVADRSYISNQFGDVYQSSLRIVGILNDGYVTFSDRLVSLFSILFGITLPSSMMPDVYNLTTYRRDIAMSGGGGLISAYSYVWLSYFGPLIFGFFIGNVIKKIYELRSPVFTVYGIMILVSVPRWFAYYHVVLFKMCLVGVIFMLIYSFYLKLLKHLGGRAVYG